MALLIQVPESLADDLCDNDKGWRAVLSPRSGTLGAALEVLAAGTNIVSLVGAPEIIGGSLETIRSWLHRHAPETTVEVRGPNVTTRFVIRDEADVEAAIALVAASLTRVETS